MLLTRCITEPNSNRCIALVLRMMLVMIELLSLLERRATQVLLVDIAAFFSVLSKHFSQVAQTHLDEKQDPKRHCGDCRYGDEWEQCVVALWRWKVEHYDQVGDAHVLHARLDAYREDLLLFYC